MLIINGDDFALSESCSKAIAEALGEGLITNTTMMATGDYFSEAVKLAREFGFINRIGVHFNLTEGRPLTDEIKNTPAFVRNSVFHKDFLKNPRELTEREKSAVLSELRAQAERLKAAGIPVVSADSHHYIHTFIQIAPLVSSVCKKYNIPRVRINRTFNTASRPVISENRIENLWWRERGFETTLNFGRMSDIYESDFPDNTEIMVHPDFDKNGMLIDRTGIEDGYPVGEKLINIKSVLKNEQSSFK